MKLPIILTILLSILILVGCSDNKQLPIGKDVIVQFDRSVLGAGANLPIPPTTGSINGADTALSGKLIFISKNWLQLEVRTSQRSETDIKTFWIPRSKVLLIQTEAIERN